MTPPLDDPGGRRPRAPGAGSPLWRPDSGSVVRTGPGRGPESGTTEPTGGPGPAGGPRPADTGKPAAPEPAPVGADAVEDVETADAAAGDRVDRTTNGDEVTVLRRERDEYLDMVRRVQADFENYKKRMLRQQTDLLERAGEALVVKLLPALDAFDLTRTHLGEGAEVSAEVKALLQASDLVDDVLAKEGVEKIAEAGVAFDPMVHDAVEHAATEEGAGGPGADGGGEAGAPGSSEPVVVEVLRPGYRWKGRVIRPAMVKVRG